jgi:asparagine N-glycosylation enzyme membrane subunit Stt3
LLALPLKLAGVRTETTIETFSAVAIPLLSLPTLWATGYVATQLGGPAVGLAAGFLLSVLRGHIDASEVGALDHHFLEALFTVLCLAFLVYYRNRKTKPALVALAALLGFAPSFWPQAWVLGVFLAASFLMDRGREAFGDVAKLFVASSLISLAPLSLSDRFGSGAFLLFGFSWWTPFLYSILALIFSGIGVLRKEKVLAAWNSLIWIALYAVGMGVFILMKNGFTGMTSPLSGGWGTVDAVQGSMAITSEAVSPGRVNLLRWFRVGYHSIVIGWLWFSMMAFRRERWWLAGFAVGPLFLTMLQVRFFPLASPIIAVGISILIVSLVPKRIVSSGVRSSLVFLGAILVALPCMPRFGLIHLGNIHPYFGPVRDASRFILHEKERLDIPNDDSAVASSWDFGHWILYGTGSPVVASPFQSSSAVETAEMFTSSGVEQLEKFVERHPIRYLVVEATPGRMFRWFRMLGKDPSPYFRLESRGNGMPPGLGIRKPYYDLLVSRLFFAQGENLQGELPRRWRLAYVSSVPSPDGSAMPALKVFERVKGARIMWHTHEPGLLLTAIIQTQGADFVFRQMAEPNREGKIEWLVPYAAVDRGGVHFSGRYTIEAGKRDKLRVTPMISEEAVLRGETVDLQKSTFKPVDDL